MTRDEELSPANEMDLALLSLREAHDVLALSPRIAAREAYLAMLHAAQARIAAAGRKVPATHKGVSLVIGELYRNDPYPAQGLLSDVENWKLAADYGRRKVADAANAETAIAQAAEFIDRMTADIGEDKLKDSLDAITLDKLRSLDPKPHP